MKLALLIALTPAPCGRLGLCKLTEPPGSVSLFFFFVCLGCRLSCFFALCLLLSAFLVLLLLLVFSAVLPSCSTHKSESDTLPSSSSPSFSLPAQVGLVHACIPHWFVRGVISGGSCTLGLGCHSFHLHTSTAPLRFEPRQLFYRLHLLLVAERGVSYRQAYVLSSRLAR